MRRKTLTPAAALPAVVLLTLTACEAEKSANPLSPAVAGPIPGVEISAPRLLEPQQGFRIKGSQQPIRLLIENSSSSGVRPLSYTFEVASDAEFGTKLFARAGVPPGEGGRTSVQIDPLGLGRLYYWRVRAEDGANTGPFQSAQFEVLPVPVLTAPTQLSPINSERITNRRATLRIRNSERNTAVGDVHYLFMIAKDQAFTQAVTAANVAEGGGETSWTVDFDLDYNLTYYWRVRATDGDTISNWNTTLFRSPTAPAPPPPGPTPGPPGKPGSCASNNGPFIAQCIAAKYPERLVAGISLSQRQENMAFIRDRMIEAGKCGGLDLGLNLKRGGPEISIDFLAWRRGDGDMGVDIGMDYDNTSAPLRVYWGEAGLGATYKAYPSVPCQ